MAQENYVEGCSMQRPPFLEPNRFCFWKSCFETYVKSKDIDIWQAIQNRNFYFEIEDEEMKLMKETSFQVLKDIKKKKLGKNEEAKMTIYNALPRKEYKGVFMCKTAKEVTAIEEAIDLGTLPFDELIGNLKVYKMVLDNNGTASKITRKERVKSLALKAKVTREQTSDDSYSQGGSDEDIDEKEAKATRNFCKFFRKGNRFGHGNRLGNGENQFGKSCGNNFGNKCGESLKLKGACYSCGMEGPFASECRKPKVNKAFIGVSWSDNEDSDEQVNDTIYLMDDSQEYKVNAAEELQLLEQS
nr:hypothetical protein [Tanacetum cinerariifolium]